MPVKEISFSLENIPGKLSDMNDHLSENGIDIIGLSVADMANISAVRMVARDPEKAVNVLKSHGYSVKITDVLAVEVPRHPGGLTAVLRSLREVAININYVYTCLGRGEKTILVIGVDKMGEAIGALKRNWVPLYDEELYVL